MYQTQASETHPTFLLGKENEKLGKEVMEERVNSVTLRQTALTRVGKAVSFCRARITHDDFPGSWQSTLQGE